MKPVSLRSLVGRIGLAVAIATAIAAPTGFFFDNYRSTSAALAFKARLNANRIAQYIYTHDAMWEYQQTRLIDQILLPLADEDVVHQHIYSADGRLVLEHGQPLAGPIMSRRATIVVAGATVGYIEVATSLRTVLAQTGIVAFLGALIGAAVFFALRTFPLRVVDRTLGALNDVQRGLTEQNRRFDAALTNMTQGLCMFDADQRLLVANARFSEIFRVPPDKIVTGMPVRALMALANGADKDRGAARKAQAGFLTDPSIRAAVTTLADNRTIAISQSPMPDGGEVVTFEDITERLRVEQKINYLAHHDALTGLLNRSAFYEQTGLALSRLKRSETLAVISLDLDHFKNVNDALGHPIGDLLLKAAADRMRSCVRGEDIVARLGGDEFAIVQVSPVQPAEMTALVTRLIEVIGAPYVLNGQQVMVGVSVGISIAPTDGNKPDMLVKNADLALYRAKADGGGIYRFFELEMDARMQARRTLELDLRKAIQNGEFELYYQPIVDVKSGQITSCEALVRWHHPGRGLIPPLEFISVAEETGLIVPLGEWVLRQALTEAARWPTRVTIAVNVSPAQFKSRNLVPTVISALATSGLAASRLELEITELVLMQETEGALAILRQFHELGIRVAMDDFGTGYSSLGYLRSFPFDRIKIDQSFIRDLSTKEDSIAIVRAVVGLGSSLGITTTAEGVETEEQLTRLTSEGCNEVQGFLFSPPRPAAEVALMLGEIAPRHEAAA